jgi:hypothetical protein
LDPYAGLFDNEAKILSWSTLKVIPKKKKKKALVASLQNDDVWLRIEGKIEKKRVNRSREAHMGRVPSNLPEKLNRRFILQLFEISGG